MKYISFPLMALFAIVVLQCALYFQSYVMAKQRDTIATMLQLSKDRNKELEKRYQCFGAGENAAGGHYTYLTCWRKDQ